MAHILIIEDDVTFTRILENFLKKNGFTTVTCSSVREGKNNLEQYTFDLILLDYRLPDGIGLDVLQLVHAKDPLLPVVIMTSFHDIRTAVKAMRSGAYEYITKPVNPDELLMILQEALHRKAVDKPKNVLPATGFITGISAVSLQLEEYIKLVAPTDMSVIIQGESGTGKERVARSIHQLSKRSKGPFIAIDCGALSPELANSELFGHVKGSFTGALQNKQGQFEAAKGGTIFLDEVGNLDYEVQVKLLRAIQEREIQPVGGNLQVKIDVRIITATNDDLLNSVKNGKFREDLYHRLNEFKIKLSPLHQRREDMQLFIVHFIDQANHELQKKVRDLSDEVRSLFYKYDWPGNLRELKNIIKRAVLLSKGDIITLDDLPDEMVTAVQQEPKDTSSDLKAVQAYNEKELIIKTLKEVRYNKSKAAKLLNIDRTTLYYKMSKYHIEE